MVKAQGRRKKNGFAFDSSSWNGQLSSEKRVATGSDAFASERRSRLAAIATDFGGDAQEEEGNAEAMDTAVAEL